MRPRDNGQRPYRLDFSRLIAECIWRLQRRATREGRGMEFMAALKVIVERLEHEPWEFGEPLYRLPVLRMQLRCAAVRPLFVDFAVCEDQPLVFLKAIKLLSNR